jgi:surface polysaccharide O-acyltransferase-like enzyme
MAEPHHPQQNPAENRIGTVKQHVRKIMDQTGADSYLWFYGMLYVVYLLNRVVTTVLHGRTPYEMALGVTPDISCLLQFAFYEPVYYLEDTESFPSTCEKLGHWYC